MVGYTFEVSNLSVTGAGSNGQKWTMGASGDRIMNTALTRAFELDDATASFKMIYSGSTYGWVIIGAN